MPAIWMAVRAELRERWREWVALAVLVALFAGAVTAVAAGARRTDSAYERFEAATRAPDMLVFANQTPGSAFAQFSKAQLDSLPGVTNMAQVRAFAVTRPADVELLAPMDTTVGTTFWTKKLIAGRLPDPRRADEVTVSFALAQADHVAVGDRLVVRIESKAPSVPPEVIPLRVVGIDAAATEFPPAAGTGVHAGWTTPAFARLHASALDSTVATALRLRHGPAQVHGVLTRLTAMAGGQPLQAFALRDQSNNTQRSIHLQAVALWILAVLLVVVALLVLAQLFVRQSWLDVDPMRQLHTLGMSTRQLWFVGMVRVVVIGLGAALAAVAIAIAASPLLPVGLAGMAEPHPGVSVDPWALTLGAVGMLLVLVLVAAVPSWWAATNAALPVARYHGLRRPSRLVMALSRWNAPVPVTTGVAWAVQPGRERTAAPVRTTIAITVVGITALTGAFVFSSSLSHLLDTPSLYGVSWDAQVTSSLGEGVDVGGALPALRADPAVAAIAVGYAGVPVQIGGVRVGGIAVDRVRGPALLPKVVAGRMPSGPREIMLGTRTMAALHAHIGSSLHASFASVPAPHALRVVGRGVFPSMSDTLGLGQGAGFTTSALHAVVPRGIAPPPDTILVRFRPGTDTAAAIDRLSAEVATLGPFDALRPDQPTDLVNFGRVSVLPFVVGSLLTLVAVAALAHLLLTAIRRRRTDLATLRVVGLLPRQLQAAIASQASTIACIALLFGVPLGIALGRGIWYLFAHQLGVVIVPVVPWAAIVVEIIAAVVLSNLIALLPARGAARMHPATALRAP